MAAEQSPGTMTVDQWRALERASPDVKHEYIDGYVYAMAGGTLANTHIASNLVGVLNGLFGDGPCIAYALDAATRVSTTRYTYPDVVVTCAEGDQPVVEEREVVEPQVVVEVLSESTERYDRSLKFAYYRECASLDEYVLVNTEYQAVEVYHRVDNNEWGTFHIYKPGDEVELTSIGVRFPLAALYKRTNVPETPPLAPPNASEPAKPGV